MPSEELKPSFIKSINVQQLNIVGAMIDNGLKERCSYLSADINKFAGKNDNRTEFLFGVVGCHVVENNNDFWSRSGL